MNFVGSYIGSPHRSRNQEEKCDVVENSAYGVTVQGSAGDRLEPNYNMENEGTKVQTLGKYTYIICDHMIVT